MSKTPTLQAIVNGQNEFLLDENSLKGVDIIKTGTNNYHLIKNGKNYKLEVIEIIDNKNYKIRIQNRIYTVNLKDEIDQIVDKLGLAKKVQKVQKEVKAPMPGMVLDILVTVGQQINKGDNLIILEAMKMENVIKSPIDSKVSSIEVIKGESVDKNQIMLHFE